MTELSLIDDVFEMRLPSRREVLLFDSMYKIHLSQTDTVIACYDFNIERKLYDIGFIKTILLWDKNNPLRSGESAKNLLIETNFDVWNDIYRGKRRDEALRDLRCNLDGMGIRAVFDHDIYNKKLFNTTQYTNVAKVLINKLPTPNESVPWEQIIEFKSDRSAHAALVRLRRFINSVAQKELSIHETMDEIEYLLISYEEYMQLHKIKYHYTALQAIVIFTAEALENLAKFRFSKFAEQLFSVGSQDISLMEAELKAPGRELAYISLAQKIFK